MDIMLISQLNNQLVHMYICNLAKPVFLPPSGHAKIC